MPVFPRRSIRFHRCVRAGALSRLVRRSRRVLVALRLAAGGILPTTSALVPCHWCVFQCPVDPRGKRCTAGIERPSCIWADVVAFLALRCPAVLYPLARLPYSEVDRRAEDSRSCYSTVPMTPLFWRRVAIQVFSLRSEGGDYVGFVFMGPVVTLIRGMPPLRDAAGA